MPIIKSAKKRVKVANKASVRNSKTKRSLREALKAFTKALDGGKSADIAKAEREALSAIDKAAKGVKPTKAIAKKAPATKAKPAAKKAPAKKPATKKTTK
jgi:ribosomal protein S20